MLPSFSKNKIYQYIFFLIIFIYGVLNGGNSNLLIQFNFLLVGVFFLFCCLNSNYNSHLSYFFKKNKISIFFFLLFLCFLIFQIIPLPLELIKFFSKEKYLILNKLESLEKNYPISLSPTNTYFQFLNFLTLFLIILICKMIFYRTKHIFRFYIFISSLGALCSFVAIFAHKGRREVAAIKVICFSSMKL